MIQPPVKLALELVIGDASEMIHLGQAAGLVSDWIGASSGIPLEIQMAYGPAIDAVVTAGRYRITIISFRSAVHPANLAVKFSDVAAYWRPRIATLRSKSASPVFLSTIFQHIDRGSDPDDPALRPARLERIRRINLFAAEISNATGAYVIDIDRALARLGARTMETDYTLKGHKGTAIAADLVAMAILEAGLDDIIPPDLLASARQAYGGSDHFRHRIASLLSPARPVGADVAGP